MMFREQAVLLSSDANSLAAPQLKLLLATGPVALYMGPNTEALSLRIQAERATETWCFNCTTDDGQSSEKKGIF